MILNSICIFILKKEKTVGNLGDASQPVGPRQEKICNLFQDIFPHRIKNRRCVSSGND